MSKLKVTIDGDGVSIGGDNICKSTYLKIAIFSSPNVFTPTPSISNHSELNLDDGPNPHGITKSDIGLGDVPNVNYGPVITSMGLDVFTNNDKISVQSNIIGTPELKTVFKDKQNIPINSGIIDIDFSLAIVHYIHVTENIITQNWTNFTLAKADLICLTFADPSYTIGGFPVGVDVSELEAFDKSTTTTKNWISVNTLELSPASFKLLNFVK